MRRFLGIISLLICVQFAVAQNNLFPRLGGQRVGTSSFSFLKIDVGARAHGMAGAYTAVADDASSLFWNPAGAAQISNSFETKITIYFSSRYYYAFLTYTN